MKEYAAPIPGPSKDERLWAMLCHLTAFAGSIIPFGHLVGPLTIWLIKKDNMPFVDDQGKEAVNFQLTMTLAAVVSFILVLLFIGVFLLLAVMVVDIVFVIVATIKANDGVPYRYPLCIRFIK